MVLRLFSRLRKLCGSRAVTWGEVDLRWGVSDELQGRVAEVSPGDPGSERRVRAAGVDGRSQGCHVGLRAPGAEGRANSY